ncbi:Gfo/Idh/MocA family protein [Shimia sp.]|uniref:Gfo/Idh/MocA family protein n=1 Tax=Shimia sp. TaxID=1954381 RepID=UPI003BAD912C
MSGAKIRWGIFGSGSIAQQFAWDMRFTRTGTLSGIASRSKENAKRLADVHPGAKVFANYEELAASDAVDAIYVATPNALHKEHCLIAISAGKAVLCEKPFATNSSDAREIVAAAKAANVFCMEAMWTRFLPMLTKARSQIRSGELGEIAHLNATLGFARAEHQGDPITDPALGGGALNDLGCYGLSIAEYLLGPFEVVGGDLQRSENGSVRTATISLRHNTKRELNPLSAITVSHATQLENALTISGTKARLSLSAPFIQAREANFSSVTFSNPSKSPSSLKSRFASSYSGQKLKKAIRTVFPPSRAISASFRGGGLQFEIDEVARCLTGELVESDIMPLRTTISIIEELDRIDNFRK